ncbi:EAL domain-containing protein [Pluralibacter gergoviae]|nr:EAL domain-containing protein [Pluralibacter gergoviae]ELW9441408.1 EAL domain-containing protein [Pluralibacter gergoviae]
MQTASLVIKQYRRRRIALCLAVALITLLLSFGQRFISQRNLNQQRINSFTAHTVETLDKVMSPLEESRGALLRLVGQPCDEVNAELRRQSAVLQTLRSISLVRQGIIYCSSVLGSRHVSLNALQPQLPTPRPSLILTTDHTFLKGSPLLLQWFPATADGQDGVLLGINIHLLGTLLLEPQPPLIQQVILSVNGRNYTDPDGVLQESAQRDAKGQVTRHSARFPLSISVKTPGATRLAMAWLPTQTPLVALITLLFTAIAWVSTAGRMSFSREINLGIVGREFELFCQPQIDARTRRCAGVEILLRWQNPRLGRISPDVFIPVAENNSQIAPLTRYVIAETVRSIDLFPDRADFHISINVAASHFLKGELLDDINTLWFSQPRRQQLVLELTERDGLQGVDYRVVHELHRKGALLAIDDFGTGSSSLLWLEQLHPDILKIDKSFTGAIGTDAVNSTVTDMIIALGQRLNIGLVAEGVETPEQADYLRQRGVHILQGYLYAEPMPVADFPRWLAESAPPAVDHSSSSS